MGIAAVVRSSAGRRNDVKAGSRDKLAGLRRRIERRRGQFSDSKWSEVLRRYSSYCNSEATL